MPARAPASSSGYSFSGWPASPPVFEAIAATTRLWVPLGGGGWRDSIEPATSEAVTPGATLLRAQEGTAAALAPAAGRCIGIRRGTLTNGHDVVAAEFDLSADPDPVWPMFDDESALAGLQRAERPQLIEWIERFRSAGIWANRRESPDLLAQLHHALRRPVDTILCSVLDADPSACLNAALAAWYGIELAAGVSLLARITGAGDAVVAIDSRAPAAWSKSLRHCAANSPRIVPLVPDYPQSDPTLMLYTLLNRRLRPGRLPVEQGVIQIDAAAAIAVGRNALQAAPMLSVPVVLRDHVLRQSFFLFAPIGMRAIDLIASARAANTCCALRGGDALRDLCLPVTALIGGGELALHASGPQPQVIPDPCVRCGWCVEACPTRVQPAGVLEAAQQADLDLAYSFGMDACIECGICTYVCPSRLPLLETIRHMTALALAKRNP